MRRPCVIAGSVVSVIAACGPASSPAPPPAGPAPPAPVVAPPPPPPVLIASEIDPPYPIPPPPALPARCTPAAAKGAAKTAGAASPKRKEYDFNPIEIAPVAWGPRIRDMPLARPRPRTLQGLQRSITQRRDVIHACYRWARWKQHDLAGTMKLTLDVARSGEVARITVDDPATWGELGRCVAEAMPTASARTSIAIATRIELPVRFSLSGQGPADKRPTRPAKVARPKLDAACLAAPAAGVDAITWASPLVSVDDFDEEQDRLEKEKAACKASGMMRCRVARVPIVGRLGGPGRMGDIDKSMIRAHVRYNQGAFGACFADALARQSLVAGGEVALLFVITADGAIASLAIEKTSTGDAVLDECVRAAMAEVRFPAASGGPVTMVHMPFKQGAAVAAVPAPMPEDTVANIEVDARAALEAGDTASALRRYAALAQHEPTCERRVDLLRALVAARPWIDDGVMAAAADLVESAPTGACAAAAGPVLVKLAVDVHRAGQKVESAALVEIAAERYQLALRVTELPDAANVRGFLADALRELGRDPGGVEPIEPR